jgi:excisionase family DNA binding protein
MFQQRKSAPIPELLSISECSAYGKVTPETVRAWIQRGLLPAQRVGPNGNWRVKAEDLARVILKNA